MSRTATAALLSFQQRKALQLCKTAQRAMTPAVYIIWMWRIGLWEVRMKLWEVEQGVLSDTKAVTWTSRKPASHCRPNDGSRKIAALANAEAERIHRLVVKLNAVIRRAEQCGVGIILTITEGRSVSVVALEVRTGFDWPAAADDALVSFGPTDNPGTAGLD